MDKIFHGYSLQKDRIGELLRFSVKGREIKNHNAHIKSVFIDLERKINA